MAMNVCALMGRLTADPELRQTGNGNSVVSFTVAVDRQYSKEEKQADFINVVAWRGTAEFIEKHFKKGQMIAVEGRIQTRKYEDKDGNNRTVFEVVANNVSFCGDGKPRSSDVRKPETASTVDDPVEGENDFPF